MARNVLLKITGDSEEAKAVVDEILAKLKELDKDTIAKITVDAGEAKADIDDVKAKLKTLSKRELIIIQIDANTAALDKAQAKLDKLRAEAAMADVTTPAGQASVVKAGSAARSVANLRTAADGLAADLAKTGTMGDRVMSALVGDSNRAAQGFKNLRTGITSLTSDIVGKVPLIGGLFSKLAEGVGSLVTTLLPDVAAGFGSIAVQAVGLITVAPIMFAIAAACAALLVFLGMVLAAVVALGIAFLVALGPIALLLGTVMMQIMKVVSGTNALKQAVLALKSAYTTLAQSIVVLHQDETAEGVQRIAAIEAQRQATLGLVDAQNALADATLAQRGNELSLQSALLARKQLLNQLAGFGMSPASLAKRDKGVDITMGGQQQTGADPLGYQALLIELKQANLTVAQAKQAVTDGKGQINDARSVLANAATLEGQFAKLGLKAFQPYLQSVQQTAAQLVQVAQNERALTTAIIARNVAAKGMGSSGTGFLAAWDKLKQTFKTIFGPAEQAVFKGIDQALTILAGHGKSLAPAFKNLGEAIGSAFVNFAKWMTSPKTLKDLGKIINDAAGLTRVLASVFNKVFTIVNDIAVDVLPSLVTWIRNAGTVLESVVKHPKAIAKFLKDALGDLKLFGGAISGFLGAMATLAAYWRGIARDVTTLKNLVDPGGVVGKGISWLGSEAAKQVGAGDQSTHDLASAYAGQKAHDALEAKEIKALATGHLSPQGLKNIMTELTNTIAAGGFGLTTAAVAAMVAKISPHVPVAAAPSPATAGGIHHHNWTLQHGNSITSDQHFSAAIERRLSAGGTGYR
jgi:hypothetical protein